MKKSEMIDIIKRPLLYPCGIPTNIDSEYLLKKLQEAGMLPPPSLTTTLGQWDKEDEIN